jgi:adenylate cyclase
MLTGRLPFSGDHEAAVIYEVLNVEPQAVVARRPDVPEHLQVLVAGLLQKSKSLRPGSAREVIDRLKQAPSEPPSTGERSIAVLYFENMSSEKESEYFCAGMTEDIITDLSKIKELKVVSRTDVFPFRNKEVNTRQVGETLRVNYVLEGSVRTSGSKMRITAQLIDVETGFHVWADRFDRLVEDIFDIQTEVSRRIAEALKISLTESEQQSLARRPTEDLRAYDFT